MVRQKYGVAWQTQSAREGWSRTQAYRLFGKAEPLGLFSNKHCAGVASYINFNQ